MGKKEISIAEMRKVAKKVDVKVKGKTADKLKEEILDGIEASLAEAKKKKQGKKWAKDNADLVKFYEQFINSGKDPEEIEEKVTEVKKKAKAKKETKVKEKKEKVTKSKAKAKDKGTASLSCYGHKPSSMSGTIDELVSKGTTLKNAVKQLVTKHGREEDKAEKKFMSHVKHLQRDLGLTIEETKGTYKADKASL